MNSSSLRPRVGDGLVMTVAHRLTQRDRSILTMLYRHRVFTTDQLAETYFDNMNTARHRLTTLYKLRLVDRFQPLDHRYASLPYRYVLGELGAMVVAAERGEDPDKSRWRADKALAIGKSQRLRPGRRERVLLDPRGRVPATGGRRLRGHLLPGVRPLDRGPGAPGEEAQELRGPPGRLRARLPDLFLLRPPAPGDRRTPGPGTGHRPGGDGRRPGPIQRPHEAIWAPVGYEGVRLRLAELASVPIPPEFEERIAETWAHRRRAAEQ